MKHIKRAALLLLALATALAFSGCKAKGKSVQAYFDAAQKRIERVDSLDAGMYMGMKMGAGGEDIDMQMQMSLLSVADPLQTQMDINISLNGEKQTVHIFLREQAGQTQVYAGNGGTWQQVDGDTEQLDQLRKMADSMVKLDPYLNAADKFELVGQEEINGRKVVKLAGKFSAEDLSDMLSASGMLDTMTGADAAQAKLIYKMMGEMPVDIYLDAKTSEPVRIAMDLSGSIGNVMQKAAKLLGDAASLSCEQMEIRMDYNSFNKLESIPVPAGIEGGAGAKVA